MELNGQQHEKQYEGQNRPPMQPPARPPPESRWEQARLPSMDHDMMDKAEDNLRKIGQFFNNYLLDLPAEVRRCAQIFQQPKFIHELDLYLRYHVLDGFIEKHAECRALLAYIFATRHPYLDPAATSYLKQVEGHPVPLPGSEPFNFPMTHHQHNLLYQQNHCPEHCWEVDANALEENIVNDAVLRESMQYAVMAFDRYDIIGEAAPVPPHMEGRYLSTEQLHYLERLVKSIGSGTSDKGKHGNEVQEEDSEAGQSGIRDRSKDLPQVPLETTIELEIDPPISDEELGESTETKAKEVPPLYGPPSWHHDKYKDTSAQGLTEYEGWMIEKPSIQLAKAKRFLSREHHVDDIDWNLGYHELGEYLAFLLQTYDSEDWGTALREVVDMFRAQGIFEDFHSDNPGLEPDDNQALLRLGAKMSGFLSEADPRLGRPVVPVVAKLKVQSHAGIVMDTLAVDSPTSKAARDPLSFTRWHKRLVQNLYNMACQIAPQTQQKSYDLKGEGNQDGDIMNIPMNYNGPVVDHLFDTRMRSTWFKVQKLRVFRYRMERLSRISPRPFITELLRYIDMGAEGIPHESLGLSFDPAEYAPGSQNKLLHLVHDDMKWFRYLDVSAGFVEWKKLANTANWKLKLLQTRVIDMLRSSARSSLGDGNRISLESFIAELNLGCRGDVKRYRFTNDEIQAALPLLEQEKFIRVHHNNGMVRVDRVPGLDYEQAFCWPDVKATALANLASQATVSEGESSIAGAMQSTTSPPQRVLPNRLRERKSLTEADAKRADTARDLDLSHNFYYRLAYRLGMTFREMEAEHAADMQLMQDPMRRGANAASQQEMLQRWCDDTNKVTPPTCRGGRVIKTYKDVVMAAEPEAFEAAWANKTAEEAEQLCKELVRKKLLEEASENKTMIWPLSVPRDSEVAAPAGTVVWKPMVQRREPLWSFAHPKNRALMPQVWNINNWPLHIQSPNRQEMIRAGGLRRW